jgi:hypothetical protein
MPSKKIEEESDEEDFGNLENEELPLDPIIAPVVEELKASLVKLGTINKSIRNLKKQREYDETLARCREAKLKIYEFMNTNDLLEIDTYSLAFVTPASIRKERRTEQKRGEILEVIKEEMPTISEERLDDIMEKLTL